jgi:hypothetical protein
MHKRKIEDAGSQVCREPGRFAREGRTRPRRVAQTGVVPNGPRERALGRYVLVELSEPKMEWIMARRNKLLERLKALPKAAVAEKAKNLELVFDNIQGNLEFVQEFLELSGTTFTPVRRELPPGRSSDRCC